MKKIFLTVILLFSFIISSLFIFLSSPTNVMATHTSCTYRLTGTIPPNGWGAKVTITGSEGDYIVKLINQDTNQVTTQLVTMTVHGLQSFALNIPGPGSYILQASHSVVGDVGANCSLALGGQNILVVTGSDPDPPPNDVSECNVTANPKTISNLNLNTTITVTGLDAGKSYTFVTLSINPTVLYNFDTKTAGSDGTVSYKTNSTYYAFEGGKQVVKDIPPGEMTVEYYPEGNPANKCTQSGVVFTIIKAAEGGKFGTPNWRDLDSESPARQATTSILNFALGIAGGVAFLLMVFGAYRLIFAAGNPEAVQQGKEVITAAIAGLIVIIFAVFILRFLGFTILGLGGL